MEHMAWKGRIKPGCKAEYQRRHAEIWPEMVKVLKEAGIPVGMIYGIITIKTKSIWPAIFLHAAHNTFDQLIFGTVTVANNKMFFVSETGIFTIIFAWIVAVFLYKKCND